MFRNALGGGREEKSSDSRVCLLCVVVQWAYARKVLILSMRVVNGNNNRLIDIMLGNSVFAFGR
jgi:hypothetical protein